MEKMNTFNMTCEDIILINLYRNRSHLEDRRLPFAVCRDGIRKTGGLSMLNVSSGVKNLINSGLVIFEKRYVETKRGPCIAYSLTPLGVLRAKLIGTSNAEVKKSVALKAEQSNDTDLLDRREKALKVKTEIAQNRE